MTDQFGQPKIAITTSSASSTLPHRLQTIHTLRYPVSYCLG